MSEYNSKCPLNCNKKGCGILLCQRYTDYQQGRADGFQEALTSNGINIYVDKIEADGAREFAEWLTNYAFDHIDYVCNGHFINRQGRQVSVDEVLAEWQKGITNE